MIRMTPSIRISLGLVLSVISILIVADLIGLVPDNKKAVIEGRTNLAESLTVQYSLAAQKYDYESISASMRILVDRNNDIIAAILRKSDGTTVAHAGNFSRQHDVDASEISTPNRIHVPIFQNTNKWGIVEIEFAPIYEFSLLGIDINPLVTMIAFVTISGFIIFTLLIRKILERLDPSSAVPERVKYALDALAEGVLLVDHKDRILLANSSFSNSVGKSEKELIGKKASSFDWELPDSGDTELPWDASVRLGKPQTGAQLRIAHSDGSKKTYMVNSAPILDEKGQGRGVMATFDDVTKLEEKNNELHKMLGLLQQSRDEITEQNEVLQVLATRDPLTDCLNRRSFFEISGKEYTSAIQEQRNFSCIMADIDFFKAINDNHGHSVGDDVINQVAQSLRSTMRGSDSICRYGGEEFCIALPGNSLKQALMTAERARAHIESLEFSETIGLSGVTITASFGVASIDQGAKDLAELIDQADKALYFSKDSGRNQVTSWLDVSADDLYLLGKPESSLEANRNLPDHDSITGLPSRSLLNERVGAAITASLKNNQHFAVLMLDFDMFKRINNALGYTIGDELLRIIGQRLTDTLRDTDVVTRMASDDTHTSIHRMGGDEFGILLTDMEDIKSADIVIGRIIDTLTRRIDIDEHEIHMSCSIGVSTFPNDGQDADTLLKNAGLALHYAKCNGHNSYQFYDESLKSASLRNLKIENDLRRAIENNGLELYYQPKLDLTTGKIKSMEALVRWQHPELGMMLPGEFIALAEESGQIIEMGNWVLRDACRQHIKWQNAGYRDISIAVNLSAIQFKQRDLLDQIQLILNETGASPQYLELEITESTIMDNIDAAADTMTSISELGIKISIDDFGTGYSSLNHLKRFPISTVKIDRSFVSDITTDSDDASIVSAIIALAHNMGLKVVAEGVETQAQLNYLRNLDCDEIQGYLITPPLPVNEIEQVLNKVNASEVSSVYKEQIA
ncbi:MAG: diguanylate cyclase [Gammaproteobacteria bacterium]|nr:diguanylate cyclase [Gammaproteobacteria bacterium]